MKWTSAAFVGLGTLLNSGVLVAQDRPIPPIQIVDSVRADSAFLFRVRVLEQASQSLTKGLIPATSIFTRKALLDSQISAPGTAPRGSDGRSSTAIDQRLERLELNDSLTQINLSAAVAFRVGVARTILTEMDKGVTFVTFAHRAIDLEQTNWRLHDLWANEEVRNGWDAVASWGNVIGGAVALAGLSKSGDTRSAVVASGAGLMGVVRLVGDLFGRDRSDRVSAVAQQIELSKRAFDALNIRNQELRTYIDANSGFRVRVRASRDTLDTAKTRADSLLAISRLTPLLTEYGTVLSQIPSYISAISIANAQYSRDYPALAKALAPVTKSADDLLQSYKAEVLPLLQYSVRLQALLDLDTVLSLDEEGRKRALEEKREPAPRKQN